MTFANRVLNSPKSPIKHFPNDRMSPLAKHSIPTSPIKPSSPYRKLPLSSPSRYTSAISSPYTKVQPRKDLPKKPYLSIDISGIPSNFYQNPLDWSRKNVIGIIHQSKPTIFSLDLTKQLPLSVPFYKCLSLKFSHCGDFVSIGSEKGAFCISDIEQNKVMYNYMNGRSGINSIEQNNERILLTHIDGIVSIIDIREEPMRPTLLEAHDGYGITSKISPDGKKFITTAEDKVVKIFDFRNLDTVYQKYTATESSVRAVEWSPNENNVAAVGGGTGDRTIRIFNTDTADTITSAKTGAQICNIFWNKEYNEIVATHGFSDCNISLWRANDLKHVSTYHVNHDRVLFAALSHDKSKLVTASPQDPMMFWLMFPQSEEKSSIKTTDIR